MKLSVWAKKRIHRPLTFLSTLIVITSIALLVDAIYAKRVDQIEQTSRLAAILQRAVISKDRQLIDSVMSIAHSTLGASGAAICSGGNILVSSGLTDGLCNNSDQFHWPQVVTRPIGGLESFDLALNIPFLAAETFAKVAVLATIFLASGLYVTRRISRLMIIELVEPISHGLLNNGDVKIDELRELVIKRNEFERMERENALGRLAVQVAHDIRSPLSVLQIVSSKAQGLPEDHIKLVRLSISRINEIAESLLETRRNLKKSNILAKSNVNTTIVDLGKTIDEVVQEKQIECGHLKGVEICFRKSNKSYGLIAKADKGHLKTMLSNLINNSLDAISPSCGKIEVTLESQTNRAIIVVSDNGKGIPEKVLSKLLTNEISYGKKAGNGIGLSTLKNNLDSWGGSVSINSTEGMGTTVTIELVLTDHNPEIANEIHCG